MPQLLGYRYTIPSPINIILYLHGIVAILWIRWNEFGAIWNGTRIEGDRSIMGLIDAFITKPFVASIPFFKAARTNDIFNRRMLVSGVFGSGLLFLGIACYDWKFGETVSEKGEGVPPSAQSYTLTDYGVFALLDGAFLMVVVEAELWWEKIRLRRQMEERIRQELLEARKEIGEREPVEKMILPSRCLESDSVEFETAAQN